MSMKRNVVVMWSFSWIFETDGSGKGEIILYNFISSIFVTYRMRPFGLVV